MSSIQNSSTTGFGEIISGPSCLESNLTDSSLSTLGGKSGPKDIAAVRISLSMTIVLLIFDL